MTQLLCSWVYIPKELTSYHRHSHAFVYGCIIHNSKKINSLLKNVVFKCREKYIWFLLWSAICLLLANYTLHFVNPLLAKCHCLPTLPQVLTSFLFATPGFHPEHCILSTHGIPFGSSGRSDMSLLTLKYLHFSKREQNSFWTLVSGQMLTLSSPLACILLGKNLPLSHSSSVLLFCSSSFSPSPIYLCILKNRAFSWVSGYLT